MKLSFLILTYKEPHITRLCIKNIQEMNLDIEYEIILVDNASPEPYHQELKELFPDIRLIVNDENIGHPSGNNVGLRVAQGEYIAMINPDIIIRSKDEIKKIVNYLDESPKVAFLGPRLHNPDGTIQNSCYRPYSFFTPIYRRTFLGKLPFGKKDIDRHLMVDFNHNETQEVEWLLGACLFIRKKSIEDIGLMNEAYFLYFGDYEWCDRARRKGWKVVYYHDTNAIFHYHKRESAASSRFSLGQIFSYVTRIHIKDWITYLKHKPYA